MTDVFRPAPISETAPTQASETPSEKLVEKPPGTVTPHQRRRARRYFTLSFFFLLFMALWLLTDYVLPDPNKAGLSARPAPAPTLIMTNWQDITPMHRRSRGNAQKSDLLVALLAREGIEPVAADAALDTLQEVFDARGLKPGQKVRIFTEWSQDADPDTDRALPALTSSPARANALSAPNGASYI